MVAWFKRDSDSDPAQQKIVDQLSKRGITDQRVLDVFATIPREKFVPEKQSGSAWVDHPLPIGDGQTISQPYMCALMTQELDLKSTHRVLEIGTGSGFQAAVLALLGAEVYTVEIRPTLYENAREVFQQLGLANIHTLLSDGGQGWPEQAPFDRIIMTAAAAEVPQPLIDQLAVGGLLLAPVGNQHSQELLKLTKTCSGDVTSSHGCRCVFVPLRGCYGNWE